MGTCKINRLLWLAGGRYERDVAIIARPAGVVYTVRTAPLDVSRLVPSDNLPTMPEPAPARVCWSTTAAEVQPALVHSFVNVPNPTCSATSYM